MVKQLWAPWRMAYIESGDGDDEQRCVFCVEPSTDRDEERLIVYRGPRVFAMMNRFPYNNGHLMIAPYQHLPTIEDLDGATLTELMTTAQRVLAAMRAAFNPQSRARRRATTVRRLLFGRATAWLGSPKRSLPW